jgi:uracil-DNA glycosylase
MIKFGNDWDELLEHEFKMPYYQELRRFLITEYRTQTVYPAMNDIFNAFKYTAYADVKAVILGQDPYHGPGQAHGLAFSVLPGAETPPSLKNMYKELQSELGCYIPNNGCLAKWARQGVLLLNTALTVRAHMANSHRGKGWETFTANVTKLLNARLKPVIFMLWGSNAQSRQEFITNTQHKVLTAPHPSPLSASRGFFGCGHFRICNETLENMGIERVDWQIEHI